MPRVTAFFRFLSEAEAAGHADGLSNLNQRRDLLTESVERALCRPHEIDAVGEAWPNRLRSQFEPIAADLSAATTSSGTSARLAARRISETWTRSANRLRLPCWCWPHIATSGCASGRGDESLRVRISNLLPSSAIGSSALSPVRSSRSKKRSKSLAETRASRSSLPPPARKCASRISKSSAYRWAQDRERYLLQHGPLTANKEVPTFEAFAPRFVDGHARANRHKPSGIASIQSILKWHLVPTLGSRRLDAITNEQVQRLKLALSERAPKTVNNVLTVLSSLLKMAVEWGRARATAVCDQVVAQSKRTMGFHDIDQYERLLAVARKRGQDAYLMVLAGGDAGLRLGEIIALEWRDINLAARRLTVERSDWQGHVTVPKGGRSRPAPDDAATDGGTEDRASSARRAGVVVGGWIADHP